LNIFIRFIDIRCESLKSSEIGPTFACFRPFKFFFGKKGLLERYYIIRPSTDQVIIVQNFARSAKKFRVEKKNKKKNICGKT